MLWEGDKNSKFIHALTNQRRAKNRITSYWMPHEIWSRVKRDKYPFLQIISNLEEIEQALADESTTITEKINEDLTAPVTK